MSLEIHHICKSRGSSRAGADSRQVLAGIDLMVNPSDIIGITGSSGAGKTTLGLILAGILKPDQGRVVFNGTDLWAADTTGRKQINQKLQMVFQHPESTFDPRWTMQQSLSEPFRLSGIRPGPLALAGQLTEVGLGSSVLARRPHQLSGGELQRLAIARIMALNPAVVVLDEPTAMLDVLTQARIMALLERIRQKTNVAYILISHDPALVHQFCGRIFRLEDGRLSG